eukprot:TRINITY_DN1511_c0_g1_i1.p1 TRINITY_DN1511_c0_g1~~TRINITY_DN1511_c0_g1_i1.p1  ORF type:complete len:408 (+),score=69.41 TRINITY_DN1511_c0_g1_i1:1039-2262(+)
MELVPVENSQVYLQADQLLQTYSSQFGIAADVDDTDLKGRKRLKVSRACTRCKSAKTCCDDQRPCRRCTRLGVEDQCHDGEQRKPGRKRKIPTVADDARVAASLGVIATAMASAASPPAKPLSCLEFGSTFAPEKLLSVACSADKHQLVPQQRSDDTSTSVKELISTAFNSPLQLFGDMVADPSVFELFTSQPQQPRLEAHSNSILENAYYAIYDCLKGFRQQFDAGQHPMREHMYRFLCLHFFDKAMSTGIRSDVAMAHRLELGVHESIGPARMSGDAIWSEFAARAYGRAPVGVIAVKFTDSTTQALYVNDEAANLFGYSVEELSELIMDPRENFFLRLWHYDDWKKMIKDTFMTLVNQQERHVLRGRFYHTSGERFEAVWSVQFVYNEVGVPACKWIYITKCDV